MTGGRQKHAGAGTDGEVPGAEETGWCPGEYSEAGRITEEMAKPGLALLAIVVLFVVAGVRTLRRRRRGDRRP